MEKPENLIQRSIRQHTYTTSKQLEAAKNRPLLAAAIKMLAMPLLHFLSFFIRCPCSTS
jgi:hypothetical protein